MLFHVIKFTVPSEFQSVSIVTSSGYLPTCLQIQITGQKSFVNNYQKFVKQKVYVTNTGYTMTTLNCFLRIKNHWEKSENRWFSNANSHSGRHFHSSSDHWGYFHFLHDSFHYIYFVLRWLHWLLCRQCYPHLLTPPPNHCERPPPEELGCRFITADLEIVLTLLFCNF